MMDEQDERRHQQWLHDEHERKAKKMRIYVAGKFEEKERVQAVQKQLIALGHTITYDWTKADEKTAVFPDEAGHDIDGVLRAQLLLLLWHPNLRGGLVELGAALALERRIVVIGMPPPFDQPCVFFHHPRVKRYDNIDLAIAWEGI